MKWFEIKKIMRRFLRDPDGNIWDDSLIKNTYNDELRKIASQTSVIEKVDIVRVPPHYDMSYLNDFEWPFADHEGKNYQALQYHQQSDIVFTYNWESQLLGYSAGSESDIGYHFAYPWESYMVGTLGQWSPIWFPNDFARAKAVFWDKDPIEYLPYKEITGGDPSWKNRSGIPVHYTRIDHTSNEFYLYPNISSETWTHIDGDVIDGMETADAGHAESSETGSVLDATGITDDSDTGMSVDSLDADDNLLIIYLAEALDMDGETDEGNLPAFLRKYVMYNALEQCYSANTDGKIESLRDYWSWRAQLGMRAFERYKAVVRSDRDYILTSRTPGGRRSIRHPRLPDTYPAMP